MPFTIRFLPDERRWRGGAPTELARAAAACGLPLEQPCGARGLCGHCRVRVGAGATPAGDADRRVLGEAAVRAGWRLGCRLWLGGDATVELPATARAVHAAKGFGDDALLADGFEAPLAGAEWGVALDVGSTTLAAALVSLRSGAVAATAAQLNPQVRYGADVVSRIHFAQEHAARAGELHTLLAAALDALIARCAAAAGVPLEHVASVVAVGNPTMLHTLRGLDVTPLGRAPYEPTWGGAWAGAAPELGLALPERARAYLPPGVRSHVGADAVAAAVATGLDRAARPALLLDLGTNSELLLAGPDGIVCTSAAAGPAFEGAGIHQGMRAAPGAVERVHLGADGDVQVAVVGGAEAVGVCGSGLVDAVAELLRAGVVERSGRMRAAAELAGRAPPRLRERLLEREAGRAFHLAGPAERPVLLTAADVRQLQLAKGGIRAGVRLLLEHAGLREPDPGAVLVAGAFGGYLRSASALAVGLLPEVGPQRVHAVGNAAGAGARLLLLDARARERAERAAAAATHLELAGRADYQDAFVDALPFPPPRVVA